MHGQQHIKIIRVISRGMRWAGYVARVGKKRDSSRVRWGKTKEKDHVEDLGADEVTTEPTRNMNEWRRLDTSGSRH